MTRAEHEWDPDPKRTMTVVTGLPRSGTSLMMQMLEAAGIEPATDRRRAADRHNPNGYFELDAVRRLGEDALFLGSVVGKAVKVVAPLIMLLPNEYNYRVIWMERDMDEVLASQRRMLGRAGQGDAAGVDENLLATAFRRKQEEAKDWMGTQANVRSCEVSHRSAIDSPANVAATVFEFLSQTRAFGSHVPTSAVRTTLEDAMAATVDRLLFHHQATP